MSAVPADMLAMARTQQLNRMADRCNIQRNTPTTTPTGGSVDNWVTIYSNVPLGVADGPAGQDNYEHLFADRIGNNLGYWLVLPSSYSIALQDRIVRLTPTTETYDILYIVNTFETWQTMTRVLGVIYA
jgi:hypothetical protein